MIVDVMPKAPLQAVQYTGDNAEEVWEFSYVAISNTTGIVELTLSVGTDANGDDIESAVHKNDWVVRIPCTLDGIEDERFVVVSDDYFREHYALMPITIKHEDFTDAELEKLKKKLRDYMGSGARIIMPIDGE